MNISLTTVNATREIPYLQILFPEWIDDMRCIFKDKLFKVSYTLNIHSAWIMKVLQLHGPWFWFWVC